MMKTKTEPDVNESEEKHPDYSKLPGFEVLEKLDDKKSCDSYNEKFYSSLDNLKFLSISIPQENKLFYNFSQNPNASITTTTGQLYVTYTDLLKENDEIYQVFKKAEEEINSIVGSVDNSDTEILDEIKPRIEELDKSLRKYLVEQKTENFKLIKEVALLQKEKDELQNNIDLCINRLEVLEKNMGKLKNKKEELLNLLNGTTKSNEGTQSELGNVFKNKTFRSVNMNDRSGKTYNTSSTENNPKYFGDTVSIKY